MPMPGDFLGSIMFNKKNIIIILAVILIVAAAFLCWLLRKPALTFEDVLPSDAIFYGRLAHVQGHLDQFTASDFFKNIAAIDVPKVLARNGFTDVRIAQVEQWRKSTQKVLDNSLLKKALGKEVGVAVFRRDKAYRAVVLVRLDASLSAAEFAGQLAGQISSQWGAQVELTKENYKGVNINHVLVKKNGLRFAYVRLGDVVAATMEPADDAQKIIDVFHKQALSLAAQEQFIFIKQHAYPKAEGLVFVNMSALTDVLKEQTMAWLEKGEDTPQEKIKIEETFHHMKDLTAAGISYAPGAISRYKLIWGIDPKVMDAEDRRFFACTPAVNDSLKFIPTNVLAYNWGSCYDFKEYWQQIKEQMQASPELAGGIRQLKRKTEKKMGLKIEEDVLPLLGHEVGGYLTDIDTYGMFPFPRLLLFVRVTDRNAVQAMLDRLVKNPLAVIQHEDYGNINIRYMTLPFGANMDPGYCFLGDYLLVGTSRQLLKKSIDAYTQEGHSALTDKNFKDLSLNDSEKNNSMTFTQFDALAKRATALVGWLDKYLSSQVNMVASYAQQGQQKKEELAEGLESTAKDLALAEKKLNEFKTKPLSDVSPEEASITQSSMANVQRDIDQMHGDIQTYKAQQAELNTILANEEVQAVSAKLLMFNAEHILLPVLKGMESLNALAVKVKVSDHALETELLFK